MQRDYYIVHYYIILYRVHVSFSTYNARRLLDIPTYILLSIEVLIIFRFENRSENVNYTVAMVGTPYSPC